VKAPLPRNEQERLQALHGSGILNSAPERSYDQLTELAASICGTPIAILSLIDSDRQWFKSKLGIPFQETSRDVAFCAHAILQQDLLVVADAVSDERFSDNPLVTSEPHIRFYAGAPLITPEGHALGTLCVLDYVPRELSDQQREALRVLSSQAVNQIELSKPKTDLNKVASSPDSAIEAVTAQKVSEDALRDAMHFNRTIIQDAGEGIIVYDRELRYKVFNPFMERLTGKRAEEVLGKVAIEVFPRLRTGGVETMLRRALAGEVVKISDVLVPKHSAEGDDVWESCTFAPQFDAKGNIVGVIGLVHDITDRHLAEETFRAIVVGTASSTGNDFFPYLVKHMAAALRVRYAFVAACGDGKHAKVLAFWEGDRFGETFGFDVEGTPCLKVVQGEVCHYRDGLVQLFPEDKLLADLGARSYLGVPMLDQDSRVIGHIAIIDDKPMERDERAIDLVRIFAARAAAELKRQRAETQLQFALQQVQELQKRLEAENIYLQEEIRKEHNFEEIVGNSKGLIDVLHRVETVAPTDSTVLILGETGCGKELIARAVHNRSKRQHRPLVKVNCGAIPTGLVESELFGHMKGAFTGALERRTGRFELADGGTMFLDEISELPPETQVKLLRVLQEHEFEPLGSSRTIKVNVRIIAASNRDLEKAVQEGRFRADLFYRLNVLPLTLPPLRERRSDIPLLASFFLERFSRQFAKQITGIFQDTMDVLSRYSWPGNIRELQNVIERAVVLCPGSVLRLGKDLLPVTCEAAEHDATSASEVTVSSPNTLESVERSHILQVLQESRGVIEGPHGAARILNLHPNTLRSRMKKLGIERPVQKSNPSRPRGQAV